jgi:hypothetical protein
MKVLNYIWVNASWKVWEPLFYIITNNPEERIASVFIHNSAYTILVRKSEGKDTRKT